MRSGGVAHVGERPATGLVGPDAYSRRVRALAVLAAVGATVALFARAAVGAGPLERHAIRGQGVSLAVPASWVAVDASFARTSIERITRNNPKLAPYVGQLSGPNSPIKFLALDPAVRGGFATNVNVVVAPTPSLSFAQYRQALVAEIRSFVGSKPIDDRPVTIAGVRAVRLRYRLTLRVGRSFTVQTLQYAFPRPGRSVVVTYTTLPAQSSRYAATFARSAASVRFS